MGGADGIWALCCGLAIHSLPCWADSCSSICRGILVSSFTKRTNIWMNFFIFCAVFSKCHWLLLYLKKVTRVYQDWNEPVSFASSDPAVQESFPMLAVVRWASHAGKVQLQEFGVGSFTEDCQWPVECRQPRCAPQGQRPALVPCHSGICLTVQLKLLQREKGSHCPAGWLLPPTSPSHTMRSELDSFSWTGGECVLH